MTNHAFTVITLSSSILPAHGHTGRAAHRGTSSLPQSLSKQPHSPTTVCVPSGAGTMDTSAPTSTQALGFWRPSAAAGSRALSGSRMADAGALPLAKGIVLRTSTTWVWMTWLPTPAARGHFTTWIASLRFQVSQARPAPLPVLQAPASHKPEISYSCCCVCCDKVEQRCYKSAILSISYIDYREDCSGIC